MAISGEEMHAQYHDRDTTCLKCPVACGKQYEIREGELAGLKAKMPEYETIFAFGSMLGNAHAASLTRANDLCDLLGLDTITHGRDAGLRLRGAGARLAHARRRWACPSAGATGAACCG